MSEGADYSKHHSILIIGGGTWGSSIAYQLAKRGYSNIKVLDSNTIPSSISAGNDLNKIIEEPDEPPLPEQDDEVYTWNLIETLATKVWKEDPLYKPHYHETGFIYAAVGDEAYRKVLAACNGRENAYTPLKNAEHLRSTMPLGVLSGDLNGWRGFWRKRKAGWVAARNTLTAIYESTQAMGVRYLTGSEGNVTNLLFNDEANDVIGVATESGKQHLAARVILAAGANSERLLDFRKQLRPTAWTLAHIPLNDDEVSLYHNLPVLYGVDRGFFIEPNPGRRELKICDEHPGYLNFVYDPAREEKRSVPFAKNQIPVESEVRIRNLLRETMPQLAERPFSFARICWDADTVDRLFLIGGHPLYRKLTLAVGASGHGFMCSPSVGILVVDLLEGKMEEKVARTLGWREERAVGRDWWDTQNRFGVVTKVLDFQDVKEWTAIGLSSGSFVAN